jgi:Toprim domain
MNTLTDSDDAALNYAMLAALRGDDINYEGPLDHPCPLCGPGREMDFNRTRTVLRTWKPSPGYITYNCSRCGVKGYASAGDIDAMEPPPEMVFTKPVKPSATSSGDISGASRFWDQATPVLPAKVIAYFKWRGIPLDDVPKGTLRFHPQCPWQTYKVGCLLARYSDAVTGEPRGIWRRIVEVGVNVTPMTLGPQAGCVIRLFPQVSKRLVIGEGIETTLAAATRLTHRGKPLRPAWATGCAGNMRQFPVLDGVEQLIILVDHDASGTGQKAAAECAQRWHDAGREVIRLMPKKLGSDFNDMVKR